ncbi:MAG: phage GP46 family protein [Aquisalimonadaceae bacterium]
MDIALELTADGTLDIALADGDLATDAGLRTAVILSLLTDRRAEPDDVLPDGSKYRRGWWADAYADQDGDQIGSRLWLLNREKELPAVRQRADAYVREALEWMIEDGVAARVDVTELPLGRRRLGQTITIERPTGERVDIRFNELWEAL